MNKTENTKLTMNDFFKKVYLEPHKEMMAKQKEAHKKFMEALATLKKIRTERRDLDAKNLAIFKDEQKVRLEARTAKKVARLEAVKLAKETKKAAKKEAPVTEAPVVEVVEQKA